MDWMDWMDWMRSFFDLAGADGGFLAAATGGPRRSRPAGRHEAGPRKNVPAVFTGFYHLAIMTNIAMENHDV